MSVPLPVLELEFHVETISECPMHILQIYTNHFHIVIPNCKISFLFHSYW